MVWPFRKRRDPSIDDMPEVQTARRIAARIEERADAASESADQAKHDVARMLHAANTGRYEDYFTGNYLEEMVLGVYGGDRAKRKGQTG